MNDIEDPQGLLRRLKLGREEYCQRLLTMLILGSYPRWNTRSAPSARGLAFLRALDELSFGQESSLDEVALFVDELELPGRTPEEKGGAPDYGVVAPARLWMIELKTEAASHRRDQLPLYVELGAHRFPDHALDLTYITPPLPGVHIHQDDRARIAHLTWDEVMPLVRHTWGGLPGRPGDVVAALDEAVASIGEPWGTWRQQTLDDLVELALRVARRTAGDGQQRGFEHQAGSLDELHELRAEVRHRLRVGGVPGDDRVQPWLWNAETSGGRALTVGGKEVGYELRFSRSKD